MRHVLSSTLVCEKQFLENSRRGRLVKTHEFELVVRKIVVKVEKQIKKEPIKEVVGYFNVSSAACETAN